MQPGAAPRASVWLPYEELKDDGSVPLRLRLANFMFAQPFDYGLEFDCWVTCCTCKSPIVALLLAITLDFAVYIAHDISNHHYRDLMPPLSSCLVSPSSSSRVSADHAPIVKKTANLKATVTDKRRTYRVPSYFVSDGVSTRADIWAATMILLELLGGSNTLTALKQYHGLYRREYVIDVGLACTCCSIFVSAFAVCEQCLLTVLCTRCDMSSRLALYQRGIALIKFSAHSFICSHTSFFVHLPTHPHADTLALTLTLVKPLTYLKHSTLASHIGSFFFDNFEILVNI